MARDNNTPGLREAINNLSARVEANTIQLMPRIAMAGGANMELLQAMRVELSNARELLEGVNREWAESRERHQAEIAQLRADHEASTAQLRERHQARIQQTIDRLGQAHQARIQQTIDVLKEAYITNMSEGIEILQQEHDRKMQEAIRSKEEFEKLYREADAKAKKLETDMNGLRNEARVKDAEEFDAMKAEIIELRAKLAASEEKREVLDKQLKEQKEAADREKRELEGRLADQQNKIAQLEAGKLASDAKIQASDRKIAELEAGKLDSDAKIQASDAKIQNLENSLALLMEQLQKSGIQINLQTAG
jgi:DNA repair exonuclease SbcCD ATPase subunit